MNLQLAELSDATGSNIRLAALFQFRRREIRASFGPTRSAPCSAETERRAAPLSTEDQIIQSMPDASPTKWHRAHTTWFFEQFLLKPYAPGYVEFDQRFAFLFNSYYVAAGRAHARPRARPDHPADHGRGRCLSHSRRRCGGEAHSMARAGAELGAIVPIVEIGLNHEQQHQELLWTDILHAFAQNPTDPVYDPAWQMPPFAERRAAICRSSGRYSLHRLLKAQGFCFDNEHPSHQDAHPRGAHRAPSRHQRRVARVHGRRRLRHAGAVAVRTVGRWSRPKSWDAPGYWRNVDGTWSSLTLGGAAAGRSGRAGIACQLLRSRRLSPVGPENTSQPRPNGRSRRGKASERDAFGVGLAVDRVVPIWPYPAIAPPGALGEYNAASSWSIRWCFADRRLATPTGHARGQLSQFLPSAGALAVQRRLVG